MSVAMAIDAAVLSCSFARGRLDYVHRSVFTRNRFVFVVGLLHEVRFCEIVL